MTLGLAIVALGFAIAALAGIPALIENRTIGDIVVVVGLAVALSGGVIMLTGVPAQRRSRAKLERIHRADIDDLMVRRNRIMLQLAANRTQWEELDRIIRLRSMSPTIAMRAGSSDSSRQDEVERRALEVERINLKAELDFNGNDLRRLGADPDSPEG
jgi:hypothetical protein